MNSALRLVIPYTFFLALVACGKSNGFQAQQSVAHAGQDAKSEAPAQSEGSKAGDLTIEDGGVKVITTPVAESPVVVAGASLTCSLAADITTVSCRIYDAALKPYVKTQSETIKWELLTDSGTFPLAASEIATEKSGVFYFLNYGLHASSILQAKIIDGLIEYTMKYDLKALTKPNIIQSMVVTAPSGGTVYSPGLILPSATVYGDEEVASENDPCLTQADIDLAKTYNYLGKSVSSTFQVKTAITGLSVYLLDICGLQTETALIFLQDANGALAYQSKLTPVITKGKTNLRAFQGISLPVGTYVIGIENMVPAADGRLDSFKTGGFQFRTN